MFFLETMRHEYIGRVPSEEERKRQDERAKLDGKWKKARIAAELARQKVHEMKLVAMKRESIPRSSRSGRLRFLVLSLRARLLALAEEHAENSECLRRAGDGAATRHDYARHARCDGRHAGKGDRSGLDAEGRRE